MPSQRLTLEKIEHNEGMDFLLADAVIAIHGWDNREFSLTDFEKRRLAVMEKMKNVLK